MNFTPVKNAQQIFNQRTQMPLVGSVFISAVAAERVAKVNSRKCKLKQV